MISDDLIIKIIISLSENYTARHRGRILEMHQYGFIIIGHDPIDINFQFISTSSTELIKFHYQTEISS